MKKYLIVFTVLLLLSACSQSKKENDIIIFTNAEKTEWGNCDEGACVTISFSYDSLASKNYDVSFINNFSLGLFKSDMNEKFSGFKELFEKVSQEFNLNKSSKISRQSR